MLADVCEDPRSTRSWLSTEGGIKSNQTRLNIPEDISPLIEWPLSFDLRKPLERSNVRLVLVQASVLQSYSFVIAGKVQV